MVMGNHTQLLEDLCVCVCVCEVLLKARIFRSDFKLKRIISKLSKHFH